MHLDDGAAPPPPPTVDNVRNRDKTPVQGERSDRHTGMTPDRKYAKREDGEAGAEEEVDDEGMHPLETLARRGRGGRGGGRSGGRGAGGAGGGRGGRGTIDLKESLKRARGDNVNSKDQKKKDKDNVH